jgi:hypothetical protein
MHVFRAVAIRMVLKGNLSCKFPSDTTVSLEFSVFHSYNFSSVLSAESDSTIIIA